MLIARLRDRQLQPGIRDTVRLYDSLTSTADINRWQLNRLNEHWPEIRARVPYYRALNLPEHFRSLEEFSDRVPILDRKTLFHQGDAARFQDPPPDGVESTGGSTGEPLRLPHWAGEQRDLKYERWRARAWFGIRPTDRCFLLWGHNHLLRTGLQGWLSARKRLWKDRLAGYHRVSAYELDEAALRRAADALIRFRPTYLVSYAATLDRLCRFNEHRADEFARLKLKVAIPTGESFPREDSAAYVARILGCPVAMEYGALECRQIAHQTPAGPYQVFWKGSLLEILPEECDAAGASPVLITCLFPRCLPLIRYRIDDRVIPVDGQPRIGMTRLDRVVGRESDTLELADGTVTSPHGFGLAIRGVPTVRFYQVIRFRNNVIHFEYQADEPLSEADEREVRRKLIVMNPLLADVRIQRQLTPRQTIAGKTRWVVQLEEDAPVGDRPSERAVPEITVQPTVAPHSPVCPPSSARDRSASQTSTLN